MLLGMGIMTHTDVSKDGTAAARAKLDPATRREVEENGFTHLAWAATAVSAAKTPQEPLITEVCIEPAKRAFASVSQATGRTFVEFMTLLEDGTVVETARKPDFLLWLIMAPGMAGFPAGGYELEFVPQTSTLAEQATLHFARVAAASAARASRPVAHDSVVAYFSIRLRYRELNDPRNALQLKVSTIAGATCAGLTLAAIVLLGHSRRIGSLFMLVVAAGVFGLAFGFLYLGAWLSRLLPVTPRSSVRELAERAERVEQTLLPGSASG
jgi:hypothetical protein